MKRNKVKVLSRELNIQLLSHPSYPSLHSVTGVLDHFNIENFALELPKNVDVLNQLPDTFFAVLSINGQNQYAVINKRKNTIKYSINVKRDVSISYQAFLAIWTGITVVVENDKNVINRGGQTNYKTLVNVLFLCLSLGCSFIFFYFNPTLFQSIHFVLSILGLGLSLIILQQELGYHSKLSEGFCSKNRKVDCDAVLNSKGAIIFGKIKLSDLSYIYFAGIVICWIFNVSFSYTSSVLVMLSLLSIPVVFYSIYYQYYVIKSWCSLCLSIASVLFLQSLVAIFFKRELFNTIFFDFKGVTLFLFAFMLVTSFWFFVKPLLQKEKEYEALKIEYLKFKRNFDLFFNVYNQNKYISTDINVSEITFGNKNAPLNIVLVTNPMCYYCKAAHRVIDDIISKHSKDVCVTIRFNTKTSDKSSSTYKITSTLMAIYYQISSEACLNAMSAIYKENVDIEKWLESWSQLDKPQYDDVFDAQLAWGQKNNIHFTPALLINERQFPKEYDRNDLLYFIDELMEKFKANEVSNTYGLEKQIF
ncbi:MAG: vitamin K epoxide reductase family protein [Xanthomarina gelatinilytica]|uniref:vitamin K epoxide reductase family protein n=1 Tax=Xanthomarina gelatinilytica TaxID=1137281 RepID=UPI003A87ABC7